MKSVRTLLAVGLLAVSLAGCANVQQAWNTLTSSNVPPAAVIVAANTFDGLEATATNYLLLPRCVSATKSKVCRDPAATKQIVPAVRSGREARNALERFLRDHPGELGPKGLYDALSSSISVLQAVFAQYNVKK